MQKYLNIFKYLSQLHCSKFEGRVKLKINLEKSQIFLIFRMEDIDALLEAMENVAGTVTDVIIDDNRRRHVSLLLSERGSWRPGTNQIYILS